MAQRKKYNRDFHCAVPRTTKWRNESSGMSYLPNFGPPDSYTDSLPFVEDLFANNDCSHSSLEPRDNVFIVPEESTSFKELLDEEQCMMGGAGTLAKSITSINHAFELEGT